MPNAGSADVDLGMTEEPEQMLEQDRAAAAVAQALARLDDGRHEEARAEQTVEQHHHGTDEQRRKGEQRQNGRREDPQTVSGMRISVMPGARACSTVTT